MTYTWFSLWLDKTLRQNWCFSYIYVIRCFSLMNQNKDNTFTKTNFKILQNYIELFAYVSFSMSISYVSIPMSISYVSIFWLIIFIFVNTIVNWAKERVPNYISKDLYLKIIEEVKSMSIYLTICGLMYFDLLEHSLLA